MSRLEDRLYNDAAERIRQRRPEPDCDVQCYAPDALPKRPAVRWRAPRMIARPPL